MEQQQHFRCLERMYKAAPINAYYKPEIHISAAEATITIQAGKHLHHAARGVHGSVYFKMLDDAAYFAANSLETEVFLLTVTFTTYLTRPVSTGTIRSVGRVVNKNKTQFIAESIVYDADEQEIGRGSGIFMRGRTPLTETLGYAG